MGTGTAECPTGVTTAAPTDAPTALRGQAPLNNNNITKLLNRLSVKTIFYKYAIMVGTKTV